MDEVKVWVMEKVGILRNKRIVINFLVVGFFVTLIFLLFLNF